jgi:hypothetical protein
VERYSFTSADTDIRLISTGAASTATHCAVFAQLIVKGKKHGVKTFVVQLRDTK